MKQYNYRDLEKIFIDPISPKCKRALGSKILEPYPQAMIRKALAFQDDKTTKARYPFTNAEYEELTARGSWNAKEYPGLSYLVDTYISPLTVIGSLMKKVYRTQDPDLIKAMLP